MLKFAVIVTILVVQALGNPASKVHRDLELSLKVKDKFDIFIRFESTSSLLSFLKTSKFISRGERKSVVANSLKLFAKESQASVLAFLSGQSDITVKSFWITNEIYVKNADAALTANLAAQSDVLGIREEFKEIAPKLTEVSVSAFKPFQDELDWGLEKIDVQSVWNAGINGTGILVGIMDTGVMLEHEALRDNYVGEYGWYSTVAGHEQPGDSDGHGTNVMGLIVGQGGIGVAPGAKWMACQHGRAIESRLVECGEFMACPHLPDGSEPDCTRAPDVVSNTWGYYDEGDFFDRVFDAWEAAGIVPIFAAGDRGPECSSIRSPGDSPHPALITVGSTDINDTISSFGTMKSSFGPSLRGTIKPDIVAPGSAVRTSCVDFEYCLKNGTSMAASHVAGVVALILSAEPRASIEDVLQSLYSGATKTVASTDLACGDVAENIYPNNHVGHGCLSASGSIAFLKEKILAQ